MSSWWQFGKPTRATQVFSGKMPDGVTNVTAYYDWSEVNDDNIKERFPIVPESALRATLGILERTVRKGL